ncbi:MAG: hypothetical protein EOM66_05330 [Clostridia bacterium]|nr:hypothetical protein [Clostridia bacterium]
MKSMGLDIGTSSLCGLVLDCETGEAEAVLRRPNTGAVMQDPNAILHACRELYGELRQVAGQRPCGLGISAQMHGILYLDGQGEPVSPLYTWQYDAGGDTEALSETCGYPMAAGYGLTTLWMHMRRGIVPKSARGICTIGDYVAMRLCGGTSPHMHPSLAHSLGMFDVAAGCFDAKALEAAGIPGAMLPSITQGGAVGNGPEGMAVCCAVGDNQASVLGALGMNQGVLINIGTGAQVSVLGQDSPCEIRPFFNGRIIRVGSALCGGRALALLHDFFAQSADMMGIQAPDDLYARMLDMALSAYGEAPLAVDVRFCGTRSEPNRRGGITGISAENFTPGRLIWGMLTGIANELSTMLPADPAGLLVASGNAARRNLLLQRILAERVGRPLRFCRCKEEAAFGAALLGAVTGGVFPDVETAGRLIQYQSIPID